MPASYEEKLQQAERARTAWLHKAAVRAADDPKELSRVARIYKVALARGQITRDGDVVDPERHEVAS